MKSDIFYDERVRRCFLMSLLHGGWDVARRRGRRQTGSEWNLWESLTGITSRCTNILRACDQTTNERHQYWWDTFLWHRQSPACASGCGVSCLESDMQIWEGHQLRLLRRRTQEIVFLMQNRPHERGFLDCWSRVHLRPCSPSSSSSPHPDPASSPS